MVEKMYEVGEYQLELHEVQKAFVDWQREHDSIAMTDLKREIGYKDVSVKYLKGLIEGTQVLDKKHAPLFVDFLASKTRYKEVEKILESYVEGKPADAGRKGAPEKSASGDGDAPNYGDGKDIHKELASKSYDLIRGMGALVGKVEKNEKNITGLETRVGQAEAAVANVPKDVADKAYADGQAQAAEKRSNGYTDKAVAPLAKLIQESKGQEVPAEAWKIMEEADVLMAKLKKKLKIKD